MTNARHVQIHLCINDPNSGSPSGHALKLEVMDADGHEALCLDSVEGDRGPVCRIDGRLGRLKLGYFWFPIRAHRSWVGNWCWDLVLMESPEAADLLNKARSSGWWTPDSGYTSYWEKWESGEPFTAAFFTAEQLLASVGLA